MAMREMDSFEAAIICEIADALGWESFDDLEHDEAEAEYYRTRDCGPALVDEITF